MPAEEITKSDLWGAIDKASPVPYHYQLRKIVESAVTGGALPVGTQIPTEAWFCDHYGVSRTVVRQALNHLELAGLVVRIKAKGTFVPPPKVAERISESMISLHEDLASRGERLETRVLRFEVQPASSHVATKLAIAESDPVILLERIGLVHAEPLVFATAHMPLALCEPILDFDMNDRSYLEVMEELGFHLHRSVRAIEVRIASASVAHSLSIRPGSPVLVFSGSTWLEDGRPIEYSVDVHRGDRSRFEIQSFRRHADNDLVSGFSYAGGDREPTHASPLDGRADGSVESA